MKAFLFLLKKINFPRLYLYFAEMIYFRSTPKSSVKLNGIEKKILNDLNEKGIVILPNFFEKNKISKLNKNLLKELKSPPDYCDPKAKIRRFIFKKTIPKTCLFFFNSKFIDNIAKAYCCDNVVHWQKMFETRELGKEGASDGYHIDEVFFHKFKAFLYLNDVDEKTAPFEFIEGSHKDRNWLNPYKSKILQYDFLKQDKKRGRGNFFSYETVNKIIKNNNFKRNVVTGKAGTLILFDSKGIHKATTPIKKGRNILANYFEVPRGQIYG